MTLPASGLITMANVNVELGKPSSTSPVSLNELQVRALAGLMTGTISMDNLHGKTAHTLAAGSSGNGHLGYQAGAFGGITPAYADLYALYDYTPGGSFHVQMNGILPQTHFARVVINGLVFVTAAAIFNTSTAVNRSFWQWNDTAGIVNANSYKAIFS